MGATKVTLVENGLDWEKSRREGRTFGFETPKNHHHHHHHQNNINNNHHHQNNINNHHHQK